MTTLAERLGVDEAILAEAIPTLITEVSTLTQSVADEKTAKEAALAEAKSAAEAAAADSAELTEAQAKVAGLEAELTAIASITDKLDPVAEAAKVANGEQAPGVGDEAGSGGSGAEPVEPAEGGSPAAGGDSPAGSGAGGV